MRLSSFRVKNFKSIIDSGECSFSGKDNILILAGQNEAGKSAVIEALSFFRNGPSSDFERLHRRGETHPEITCKFELDDSDLEAIFEKTKNNDLKSYLKKNRTIGFMRGWVKEDDFDDICFSEETRPAIAKFLPDPVEVEEQPEETEATETEVVDNVEGEQEENNEEETPEGEQTNTPESDPVQIPKKEVIDTVDELDEYLCKRIREYVLYNSFTDVLPGETLISEIQKHPAVKDFQDVFAVDFSLIVTKASRTISKLENEISKKASDDLNQYWQQRLDESSKYNFKVKISKHEPPENSTIEFMIDKGDGDSLYIEQKSKGFQWFSAFNLRLRALGVKKTTINNLIIMIDEPGQGLHEKAQRDVKAVIEELAERGAQIIYTTHHPNLIGTQGKEITRIRLVTNTIEDGTKVETITQFAARSDQGSKDALSPLVTAMGIHCAQTFLDSNKLNVIVEGVSDHYYLSALCTLLSKEQNIYFVPACGVNNVPNLMSILLGWGYDPIAVFDDDGGSGRKAYNLLKTRFYEGSDDLTHQHVLKINDCIGIEDVFSQNDFAQYVLNENVTGNKRNSELAKDKKEILARLFLEKVENGKSIDLDAGSLSRINEVFDWIKSKQQERQ